MRTVNIQTFKFTEVQAIFLAKNSHTQYIYHVDGKML